MKLTNGLLILSLFTLFISGCASDSYQGMSPEEMAMRDKIEQSKAGYGVPQAQFQTQEQADMSDDASYMNRRAPSRVK